MLKSKQTQHRRHQVAAWVPQTKRLEDILKLRKTFYLLLLCGVIAGCNSAAALPRFRGRIGTTIQICWFVTIFACLCVMSYQQYFERITKYNNFMAKIYIPETSIYLANICFLMVVSVRRRQLLGNLIEIIVDFDLASSYSLGYKRLKRCMHHQLLYILAFALCALVLDFRLNENMFKFLFSSGTYVLPNILICISLAQYYVLLYGVLIRMEDLMQTLESMFQLPVAAVNNAALQQIRLQHALIIRFTKKINQIYGPSVLFIYVGAFINCSFNLFTLYKYIDGLNQSQYDLWAYTVIWYALHGGKIFTVVYVNHCIQQQQRKCLALFSKVRCEDPDLIETINQYVLHLQANERAHVVGGLIVLDLKLLKTLLMAITNFFIFLLQYDITYEALKLSQTAAIQKLKLTEYS